MSTSSPSLSKTLFIFLLFAFASLAGGAVIGSWVVQWGMGLEDGWLLELIEKGKGPTIVRRIQTLTAIALAPWLLKQIGWKGFTDLGWKVPRPEGIQSVKQGYLAGLVCMGVLFAISMNTGDRIFEPDEGATLPLKVLSGFLITGIGVAVAEETMARGVLFQSLARSTTPWLACLLTSILFSYAHFAEIEFPSVFEQGTLASVRASLMGEFVVEQKGPILLEFINLALLGTVFCRMVTLKDHIWLAVGFHASAVGMIKAISLLTNIQPHAPRNPWIGHSSGFLDGFLCLLFLGLVLGVVEFRILRKGQNH